MNTNKKNNNNNPYGHLLDKYLDSNHVDWRTREQREKEAKEKYGNLLDKAKPDMKIYEDIVAVRESFRQLRDQREEECRLADIRRKERIECEKRKAQERQESQAQFVNSMLAKKEAERRAAEEKRREEEHKQGMLDSIQKIIDARDCASAKIKQTNAMLAYHDEKQKEHEEKMKWFDSQKKYIQKKYSE